MQKTSKIIKEINELSNYFNEQGDFKTAGVLMKTKQIIKKAEFTGAEDIPEINNTDPLQEEEKDGIGMQGIVISEIVNYLNKKVEQIKNAKVRIIISKLIIFLESQMLKEKEASNINKIYKYAQVTPGENTPQQQMPQASMQQQQAQQPMQQNNMQKINQLLQYNLKQLASDPDPNIRTLVTQIVNLLSSRM